MPILKNYFEHLAYCNLKKIMQFKYYFSISRTFKDYQMKTKKNLHNKTRLFLQDKLDKQPIIRLLSRIVYKFEIYLPKVMWNMSIVTNNLMCSQLYVMLYSYDILVWYLYFSQTSFARTYNMFINKFVMSLNDIKIQHWVRNDKITKLSVYHKKLVKQKT